MGISSGSGTVHACRCGAALLHIYW